MGLDLIRRVTVGPVVSLTAGTSRFRPFPSWLLVLLGSSPPSPPARHTRYVSYDDLLHRVTRSGGAGSFWLMKLFPVWLKTAEPPSLNGGVLTIPGQRAGPLPGSGTTPHGLSLGCFLFDERTALIANPATNHWPTPDGSQKVTNGNLPRNQ